MYLLRVFLPDRPGSLGLLAMSLGNIGADILSLDVVERIDGYAVDDLVVEVKPGALPDTLITAAEKVPEVQVDSIRPYVGLLDSHRELELINHVASAPNSRLQTLVDEAPRVLRVSWAQVVSLTQLRNIQRTSSSGAPETEPVTLPWLPLESATSLDPEANWIPSFWQESDTRLAAAPLGTPDRALLLGRTGGPDFRPAEIARLGYLAGIISSVLRIT